jgi:hypothetical protein
VYEYAIDQFIGWYGSEPRLAFNRISGGARYRMYLESRHWGRQHHQPQQAAVRRLAHEAGDDGWLSSDLAAGFSRGKGLKQLGFRSGDSSSDGLATFLVSAFTTALLSKVTGFSFSIWSQS